MTEFDEFESGVAVMEMPEEEKAAAPEEEGYDVDIGYDMEWEVETEPSEEPVVETVQETVVEEYYEPNYRRGYDPGYGGGYDRGYGQGYYQNRRVARRINKHVFTWVLSFVLGIYGADRFARGQTFLGLLKLCTFGGLGFWYLYDVIVAAIQSYAGTSRDSDDLMFDQYGQYV